MPPEHAPLLANTAELAGTIAVRDVGGRRYLMAYPADPAAAPYCALATDDGDNTALWVQLTIDVVVIGLGVWGLRPPSGADKLTKVGVAMWRTEPVRQAFMALYVASVTDVPRAFFDTGQTMYREGFLSQLLSCFSISWFTLVRLVALFVPWVAVALTVADLGKVANDLWQRTRRQPDRPSPSVTAVAQKAPDFTGAAPITVNGDPVVAMVSLTAPPPSGSATVAGSTDRLALAPGTLTFSAANWSVPQAVEISAAAADESTVPQDSRVRVVWAGAGVVGEASVDLHVQVAKLVLPDEVQLLQNEAGDFEASFEVSVSAEVASDAPVTVTLTSPNGDDGQPTITFEPNTLTFQNAAASAATVGTKPAAQSVRAKRKAAASGDDVTNTTANARSKIAKPLAAHSYGLRVRKLALTEKIVLTMVRAGSGNCFVLQNTSLENGQVKDVQTSVYDGGVEGTYTRMATYLPAAGSAIKYVLCTHYDNDHIQGLIDLMNARAADVGSVLFNPPPPAAALASSAPPGAGPAAAFAPHNIMSVEQGQELVTLVGAKLVTPVVGIPPATLDDARFALPSLKFRFAGPTAIVLGGNLAHPRNGVWINRASIMFLLVSTVGDSGFKMLMTGDGENKPPHLDVTGPATLAAQNVDFLQVPHHGSVVNSDQTLYRAYLAKHYLISSQYSRYRGAHPAVKVVQDIVEAAQGEGHFVFSIWINDPDLPADFELPPAGSHSIYRLNANENGGSFTYETGKQIQTPANYTRISP
ncbi:MAG TPA: MBL fold metallo-hydrolase [Candidatus Polarisedimenticolia bacterium]|nr:MBL fold metallo-hydrolase [Candidatus Polarisedimenticolia bacterium]